MNDHPAEAVEIGARILHAAHDWDLEECREDAAAILTAARNLAVLASAYPDEDGDVIVLGPEVFATKDGSAIYWKGEAFIGQGSDHVWVKADVDRLSDAIRWALDTGIVDRERLEDALDPDKEQTT